MPRKTSLFFVITLVIASLTCLVSCGRSDPQAALESATKELQTALEKKDSSKVLDLLHPEFYAQQPQDDRDWAKQTMALAFMRYKNINVIALRADSYIDPKLPSRAYTEAEVALTGAEGLIPDSARHYRVHLEWMQHNKKWALIRLQWE